MIIVKNKDIVNKTLHNLTFILWGVLFLSVIVVQYPTLPVAWAAETELLEQVLRLEFPGSEVLQWEKVDEGVRVDFVYNHEERHVYFHDPIERDLDGDSIPEVLVVCEFRDLYLEDEDFLGIYSREKDNELQQCFRKELGGSHKGGLLHFQVEDSTGNGLPDISVEYMIASAGMHLWMAEDYFYLIRGHLPFDSLLELQTREGIGGDIDDGHIMTRKLEMKDVDGDGINEILVHQFEGKDWDTLKQVTQQPDVYRARFKLTAYSFEHLRQKGLPEGIVQGLQPLAEQEFATKAEFLQAVKQQIGKEETEKYETLLVQYAIFRYQLEGE